MIESCLNTGHLQCGQSIAKIRFPVNGARLHSLPHSLLSLSKHCVRFSKHKSVFSSGSIYLLLSISHNSSPSLFLLALQLSWFVKVCRSALTSVFKREGLPLPSGCNAGRPAGLLEEDNRPGSHWEYTQLAYG